MKKLMLLVAAILLMSVVGAQSMDKDTVIIPPNRAYDESNCFNYQIKMLYQATDLSLTRYEMEKRMIAANAFKQLGEEGQLC